MRLILTYSDHFGNANQASTAKVRVTVLMLASSCPRMPYPPAPPFPVGVNEPEKSTLPPPFAALAANVGRAVDSIVGVSAMISVLAVISAVPVLNLLSLGYLLEASGRVARSGRLRDGWVGLAGFTQLGRIFIAGWIALLPVRLIHSFWRDAELIGPNSASSAVLRVVLIVVILLTALYLFGAVIRGGKWRHFLWPSPWRFFRWLGSEFSWNALFQSLFATLQGLRLLHFLRLGTLGFAGAALWLVFPVSILMTASGFANPGISFLLSLLGSLFLAVSALYLPFLQTRFALTGKFGEFFDPLAARLAFGRAPVASCLALTATLLFALPPYLLKVELTPSEVAWLPNVFFVLCLFPARLLLGWALSRSERRESNPRRISRWVAHLAALPVVATYVFFVWISQYLSWHGTLGLIEQHAFLVPSPLLGL